jgi:hypothetical protein
MVVAKETLKSAVLLGGFQERLGGRGHWGFDPFARGAEQKDELARGELAYFCFPWACAADL